MTQDKQSQYSSDRVLEDGEHREYYEDRSLKAVYTIKQGKKDGTYTEYYKNSKTVKLTEEYLEGRLHGKRKGNDVSGTEIYEHGILTERRWNSNRYEIYKNGELYRDVSKRERQFIDMCYKDGKEYDGIHYQDSENYGPYGDYYMPELKYTLKDGKYHGEYIDEKNNVRANYDMGVLHGECCIEEKDGSIRKGNYNQGKFTGNIVSEDKGRVEDWVDGVLDSVTTYNGDYRRSGVISKIRPNGLCFEWQDTVKEEYEQKDGVKNGGYKKFDHQGWLREEGSYREGQLNGYVTEYNSDGTVASRSYYKDGKNLTERMNMLKDAGEKNVASSDRCVPKQSKVQKAILAMKMRLMDRSGRK